METKETAAALQHMYRETGWPYRFLSVGRPFICPFDPLLEQVPQGASILDVGCGSGVFLNLLARRGRISHGIGIDASAPAIEAARTAAAVLGPVPVQFQHRPVEEGLPDGVFQVVSLVDVLHHIPRALQRATIEAISRKVAEDGILLVKDVGKTPVWRALANRLHDLLIAREWIHIVPVETVIAWIHAVGFELEHKRTINMLWYGHELLVFRRRRSGSSERYS